GLTALLPHQGMAGLVEHEILPSERCSRDETIGTRIVESYEQPGPDRAADASFENRAGLIGKMTGDQPIDGLALGRHCPALGRGNHLGGFLDLLCVIGRQTIIVEIESGDQCAMDDEISVAADRRGEVRVAAKVEPEMAAIFW